MNDHIYFKYFGTKDEYFFHLVSYSYLVDCTILNVELLMKCHLIEISFLFLTEHEHDYRCWTLIS